MLNKLASVEERFEEICQMLYDPAVIADLEQYSSLLKEHKNLEPIITKFREYKAADETLRESRAMLDEGGLDKDFREMVQEEYENAKESTATLYEELKILLLPKDPNDDRNVIVEINVDPELILCQGTEIKLDAGLMGGCAMKITPAPINDKVFLPGDTLLGTNHMDMVAQASKMMPQLSEIVKKVDTLVSSLNRVINDPKLASILSNVEQVTADLTKTTEHLNTIVGHDLPQLAQTYNKVGENVLVITENFKSVDLQPTIASVNATIENVNAMVQQMHNTNGTLGALLYDRSLYNSLNKTVGSMDSLMTDIKSHPKRYVHFSIFGRKDK